MKKKNYLFLLLLFCTVINSTVLAQDWQMKKARIMSPWAEKVDPKNVLNDYPRPQMVRNNWYNLNGVWNFTKVEKMAYNSSQAYDKKILVPFPMESAISGIMDGNWNENKGKVFAYRKNFSLPANMKKDEVLLHFGAVDWKCEVYINGKKVGGHKGGFDPFYFNITQALDLSKKEQEICVFVQDYQEYGGYMHGKQKINEKIIWYTPVTGIWQTVWLESVPKIHVESLLIKPDIDNKVVNLTVRAENPKATTKATIKVYDGKKLVSTTKDVALNENISIPVNAMKLWSPESPFLYDMKIELTDNGKVIDKIDSYFGMRKISLGNFNGHPVMFLNNKRYFHYGVLDQGFWPDGIYTAPTDEALKYDLEKIKEFGMNMTRKHIKVEPARWYYHCDKMGLLVWQDVPNPGFGENGKIMGEDKDLRDNFHEEMTRVIKSLENYPSIVVWTVYNEGWGQPDEKTTRKGIDIVKSLNTDRIINGASGWHDTEYGDLKDTHWYPEPNMLPNPVNKRASVCGEYGGITLRVEGHQWLGGSRMLYTEVHSQEELKNKFISFTNQILGLQADGLCAVVYTQITDVEDEENGLMTYDRKVTKVDTKQLAEIKKAIERNYTHTSINVIPVSQKDKSNKWKYFRSDSELADKSWKDISFSDKNWKEGEGGFGDEVPKHIVRNTKWTSSNIYLRKWVDFKNLDPKQLDKLTVQIFHDEDCEVYINGILAVSLKGFVNRYVFANISDEAKASIKFDKPNLIAVSCKQTTGGQFIDLGFSLFDVPVKP